MKKIISMICISGILFSCKTEIRKPPEQTKIENSPIIVYKTKLVNHENSNLQDLEIYFKNASKKEISGIGFEWCRGNTFNEPTEVGYYTTVGGSMDSGLKVDASGKSIFSTYLEDRKKISARAFEVMFEDGSKWTLQKEN